MSQFGESSGGSRSRFQPGRCSRIGGPDPVGDLSGFPLVPCPECRIARVVEGHTKKDSENHGHLYFKCSRNGYPKLCGYYRFEKQYFEDLKDAGIILVRPSNWADLQEEEGSVDSDKAEKKGRKELEHNLEHKMEQKMEQLMWKMNMFIVCVLSVVFGCVLMYAVMK